jgi:protein gp37
VSPGLNLEGIDWLIAGGESGPGARRCDEAWLRDLRDVCEHSGTAFFLKQLGGHPDKRGHDKALLDSRLHHEMPEVARAA